MDLPAILDEAVVIVSNKRRVSFGQEVKATVALQERGAGPPATPPDHGQGAGCSCEVDQGAGGGWMLILFMLGAIRRRRGKP